MPRVRLEFPRGYSGESMPWYASFRVIVFPAPSIFRQAMPGCLALSVLERRREASEMISGQRVTAYTRMISALKALREILGQNVAKRVLLGFRMHRPHCAPRAGADEA